MVAAKPCVVAAGYGRNIVKSYRIPPFAQCKKSDREPRPRYRGVARLRLSVGVALAGCATPTNGPSQARPRPPCVACPDASVWMSTVSRSEPTRFQIHTLSIISE